jgi:hypothetical protein
VGVAYHETFWVAAAAAAPVIALANTVSLADASRFWFDTNKLLLTARRQIMIIILIIQSCVNFLMQSAVLAIALICLSAKSDEGSPVWPVIVFLAAGLLIVLLNSISVILVRFIFSLEESRGERPRANEIAADGRSYEAERATGLGWPPTRDSLARSAPSNGAGAGSSSAEITAQERRSRRPKDASVVGALDGDLDRRINVRHRRTGLRH